MDEIIKNLFIIGAGGHAKEIAYLIEDINITKRRWNILGFISNNDAEVGNTIMGYEIFPESILKKRKDEHLNLVIAIGNSRTVKKIHCKLMGLKSNIEFPNIIHPRVVPDMRGVSLGIGNIICAGNIFTTNIRIGSFNCINRACNISHDVRIADYCIVNPGVNLSGGVEIEDGCLIGTGATILQYLKIGSNSVVGAGAVVIKNVRENTTVVGVPAKEVIKQEV